MKAYEILKTARTVEMKHYDAHSIRQTMLYGNDTVNNTVSAMPIHDVTSPYNMPYRKFKYDDKDIEIPQDKRTVTGLKGYFESNPCNPTNSSDRRGWRVPNQKEIAILKREGVLGSGAYISCTYGYFNSVTGVGGGYVNGQNMFMAMYGNKGMMMTSNNLSWYGGKVRCVRDEN